MDHSLELRIDLFLYFLIAFGDRFSGPGVIVFTTFFALRIYFPDIVKELEKEITKEITEDTPKVVRAPQYSEVEINNFSFE